MSTKYKISTSEPEASLSTFFTLFFVLFAFFAVNFLVF